MLFTGSVIPAVCWASSMRWALTGAAFALFHARCRASAKLPTPLRYSFHALCMISERLYFFIVMTSLLYLRVSLWYNGADLICGFGSVVCLSTGTGPFFIYSFQEVGY